MIDLQDGKHMNMFVNKLKEQFKNVSIDFEINAKNVIYN